MRIVIAIIVSIILLKILRNQIVWRSRLYTYSGGYSKSYFYRSLRKERGNMYLWTPLKKVGFLYFRNYNKELFYLDDFGFIKV